MKTLIKLLVMGFIMILSSQRAMGWNEEDKTVLINGVGYTLQWDPEFWKYSTEPSYWCTAGFLENPPENIVIPDKVTFTSTDSQNIEGEYYSVDVPVTGVYIMDYNVTYNVKSVYIPKSAESALVQFYTLESIVVDSDNPYLSSYDGCLYDQSGKRLLIVPGAREQLTVPDGVETIGNGIYSIGVVNDGNRFMNLRTITLPSSIKQISAQAFCDLSNLEQFDLPSSLLRIEDGAFTGCYNFTGMYIPASVKYIGRAFPISENFTNIDVDEDNEYYSSVDGILLSKNHEKLYCLPSGREGTVNIPAGVKYITNRGCSDCEKITKVIMPSTLKEIGEYAFDFCSSLKWIILNEGLETIQAYGLNTRYEYKLDGITLPKSLKYIGQGAILCDNITSLSANPPEAHKWAFGIFYYENQPKRNIIVPKKSLTAYKEAEGWNFKGNNFTPIKIGRNNYIPIKTNEVFQNWIFSASEDADIKWTSSDPSIAYVNESNLVVSMGKRGTCFIYVHDGEYYDSIKVSVSQPAETVSPKVIQKASGTVEHVVIDGVSADGKMLNVHLEPNNVSTGLQWASSDENVATIDHGLITFKSNGPVTFNVTSDSGETVTFDCSNPAGIDILETTDSNPVEYYNLQGIKVSNPTAGIYIRKQGAKTAKIVL